ncbi:hypothetical protein EON65_37270 [archaeon]|nr:MAG: hypothetical protein EON65_37270 [archaeon]
MQCTRRGPTYLIRWDLETKILEDHASQAEKRVVLIATVGKVRYLTKFAASKLAMSADGSLIAVGASDGRLLVCDSAQFNVVHDVLCHDFPITGVGFAPSRLADQAGE